VNKLLPAKVQRSKTINQIMKKLLFVCALTVLLVPFVPQAKSQDVSVDFFYNNLNGGELGRGRQLRATAGNQTLP